MDFSLATTRGDGSDAILAGHHHERDLPPFWLEQPEWRTIRDHYRRWMQRESVLHEPIQSTWLEFDHDQLLSRCCLPSVFVGFRDTSLIGGQPLCGIALNDFVAHAARAEVAAAMQRMWPQLPTQSGLPFVGVMLPRDRSRVRLCIALPLSELTGVASRIGFPASRALERLVTFASGHADSVVLHLDVGARLGPTLGVELKPVRRHGWSALLSDLAGEGLCTAGEREALLAFPGQSALVRSGPEPTGAADPVIGSPDRWRDVGRCLIVRSLNHIKLICRPDQAVTAKAYMHIGYAWGKRVAPRPPGQGR
ncbi:hypothetical protein [Roseomonas genomospecies 6]|uniref:hypothetical protein n=1 Tax=Roseomonas genomospecies 6 TaxID=214106 RepID=UPI0011F2B461|nr:hypothetical protein [Roseomonas genomospecies 6]